MKKRLLVVSIDALFSSDIEKIRNMSAFGRMLDNSLLVNEVMPIYPALTYPCHTSIVTGCYPDKHGIYHNEVLEPHISNIHWNWDARNIKVKSLFHYLREAGVSTSSVFWPVSAHADVDYLVPEIWSRSYDKTQIDTIKEASSHNIDDILERHQDYLDFTSKEKLDIFATNCAVDIINEYQPEAMFFHLSLVDNYRHKFGCNGDQIMWALEKCNGWVQEVLDALKNKGVLEDTTLVLLGDHGHIAINKTISMNYLFQKQGLLTTDESGKVVDYKVYCHGAGLSAQIYVKDESEETMSKLHAIFDDLKANGYVMHVFDKETLARDWHVTGDFAYFLEANESYSFVTNITKNLIEDMPMPENITTRGKHGHLPTRENKTVFAIQGKKVVPGTRDSGCIVDVAPTILEALEIPYQGLDGKSKL